MSKSSEIDQAAKLYILDGIDGSGYDVDPQTVAEKIAFLKATFESEYGWAVERQGLQNAVKEWLSGLPSSCNIEYRNHAILELAVKWGSLLEDYTEHRADKILENWFNFMASRIVQLFNGYHLPKEA